jgi:hypothetical protein
MTNPSTENTMTTYEIKGMTVVAIDRHGEVTDLNASGEPCQTAADLRDFIGQIYREGGFAFDRDVDNCDDARDPSEIRDELLAAVTG